MRGKRKPWTTAAERKERQHADIVERQRAVDRVRALDQAIERLELGHQRVDLLARLGAQRDEIAVGLVLAHDVMVARRDGGEFRQAEQRIARHGERRGLRYGALGPGGDVAALRPGQDRFAEAFDMRDHVHAFQHRRAVVLDQNRDHPLADQLGHGRGIVVEHHAFLQMPALERRRHAHAKAQRAMLEQIKPHAALSLRRARPATTRSLRSRRAGRDRRAFLGAAPAAILGEELHERVHGLEPRRIDHRAALAPHRHQPGIAQPVEMKRQRVGRKLRASAATCPAGSPAGPACTSRRNTSSRLSCASAAKAATASGFFIFR